MSDYIPSPTQWVADQVDLWALAVAAYPPYQAYQERTERVIPIFVAEPRE